MRPETSIIIVTFNSRAEIDACLTSVLAYSLGADIIIIDNLSTDGTLEYVQQRYPGVQAFSSGGNIGFGAGVNMGARRATGEFLAVLNPDTVVEDGWLKALTNVLKTGSRIGLATPTILLLGSDYKINACGNNVHITGLASCARLNEDAPSTHCTPRPVAAVSGAAFALRKTLWDQLNGFDESFFMYLEDTDLSLRARRFGYITMHVPASRVWHHYSVRINPTKLYHLERNRLLMLRKNLSSATLKMLIPALLLAEAITWTFCIRNGTDYVRAKWWSYTSALRESRLIRLKDQNTLPRNGSDAEVILSLGSRVAIEQVKDGKGIAIINDVLTLAFTCWRALVFRWLTAAQSPQAKSIYDSKIMGE